MKNTLLFLCFISFLQINHWTSPAPPSLGLVFMKFRNLGSYKVLNTYVFFCLSIAFRSLEWPPTILISIWFTFSSFKIRKYIYFSPWLMYLFVSALYWILFSRCLVRYILILCYSNLLLFHCNHETMTFYWIIWEAHNGDPSLLFVLFLFLISWSRELCGFALSRWWVIWDILLNVIC